VQYGAAWAEVGGGVIKYGVQYREVGQSIEEKKLNIKEHLS
jgi:hypothetical protein